MYHEWLIYLSSLILQSAINNILLAYVRNDNHPKLAMRAMLIGSFSNIILDYIFIFPFNMGMLGAALATALATALAPIISVLVLLSHFIYRKNTFKYISSKLSINIVRDIFSLGLSSFIIEISSAVVLITLNIVILRIEGNIGLAAYGIVANLALVVIAIFTGLAQGTQPLISKYFGQGNRQMVRAVRTYALVTALFIAATIYFFTYMYSNTIIQIFNSENNLAVSAIASIGLEIYFLGFFFSGLNIIATMVLSATASIKHALLLSISRGFLITIPTIFIFSYFWDMKGVWWAFVITELLTTLLAIQLEKTKIIKEQ
ncbi:Multidrug export protein MepA [Jeotgalibaca dankookensis]|uniref:Multidrug export protein MepA n=2 Tax=Jeotgalibaca dankookensis TaxID=708126 RepID=A0A1S6IQX9_9LACT|nr:MATE family efflux transporter [Jeotgalibaca dankookensis]AQS53961.1 Multidrug export protein MepA [Jeotgalibaca dankookensis]